MRFSAPETFRPLFRASERRSIEPFLSVLLGAGQQVLVGFGVLWFGTVMFALFGKFCHPPDCDESEYFGSLWLSVLSSFTILTTANYPDVMLPAYGYNRLFGMPFVLFAAFGPPANTPFLLL